MANDTAYPGQWGPEDSSSDHNVLWFIIQQALSLLSIATYCKVKAVHGGGLAAPPTVDVQPLVEMIDGQGNLQEHGTVYGLQVYRVQGGTNAVICDPIVGDIGKVVCCDRDVSAVIAAKGVAGPGSRRKFELSDGTFFPCVLGAVPTQYVQFTSTGITIADKNGNTIVMDNTGITINGVKFDTSQNITNFTQATSKSGVTHTLHTHSDPQGGSTGTPTG